MFNILTLLVVLWFPTIITSSQSSVAVCFVGQFLRNPQQLRKSIQSHFHYGKDRTYDAFISTSTQLFEEDPSQLVDTLSICNFLKTRGMKKTDLFVWR